MHQLWCIMMDLSDDTILNICISYKVEMGTLQGPGICRPVVHVMHAGVSDLPISARLPRSGFWGSKGKCGVVVKGGACSPQSRDRTSGLVRRGFSSSSGGNDSMAGNFNENDGDYVNCSVLEAAVVKICSDGFMIKMHDGGNLRCIHNNPREGPLPDFDHHLAIVLKMNDGSNLLLPIFVLETPSVMLNIALRNIPISMPTIYQVVKEMVVKMGYEVRLVRVTKRVRAAYFAQLYLAKVGNGKECISFDLRPSDAINIAVRCNVPVQVNKHLIQCDGMRLVKSTKQTTQTIQASPKSVKRTVQASPTDGLSFIELDRPDGQPCLETKEFCLVRNMVIAAVEERYRDAARWRDQLKLLRAKRKT